METLDQYFGNVCELDIVFNFHKVYGILDEIILGGEILETSKNTIINNIKEIEILEWLDISIYSHICLVFICLFLLVSLN